MADEKIELHALPPPKVKAEDIPRVTRKELNAYEYKVVPRRGPKPIGKDTRFKPGIGGNPAGMSKTAAQVRMLMQEKSARCVELLMEAAEKGSIDAAKYLVDQGVGKAKDRIEVDAPHLQELAGVASAALLARVKEIQAKMVDALPVANLEASNGETEDV